MMVTTIKYSDFSISLSFPHSLATLSPTMSKDNNTDAQTAFDIDESKVFQACCCSFLGFYWPEPGGMGCFGCASEGDLLCLSIG